MNHANCSLFTEYLSTVDLLINPNHWCHIQIIISYILSMMIGKEISINALHNTLLALETIYGLPYDT